MVYWKWPFRRYLCPNPWNLGMLPDMAKMGLSYISWARETFWIIRVHPKCYRKWPRRWLAPGLFAHREEKECEAGAARDFKMLAFKTGEMWPPAKECWKLPYARKGKEQVLRWSLGRECSPANTLISAQGCWCWAIHLQNHDRMNLICIKPPRLWQFVKKPQATNRSYEGMRSIEVS